MELMQAKLDCPSSEMPLMVHKLFPSSSLFTAAADAPGLVANTCFCPLPRPNSWSTMRDSSSYRLPTFTGKCSRLTKTSKKQHRQQWHRNFERNLLISNPQLPFVSDASKFLMRLADPRLSARWCVALVAENDSGT